MLPNAVARIIMMIFTNPQSRVFALELLARTAVHSTRRVMKVFRQPWQIQTATATTTQTTLSKLQQTASKPSSISSSIAKIGVKRPGYRYLLGATVLQFGIVQAWLRHNSEPEEYEFNDTITMFHPKPTISVTVSKLLERRKRIVKLRKRRTTMTRRKSLVTISCIACNVFAIMAVVSLIDAPVDMHRLGDSVFYDIKVSNLEAIQNFLSRG